MKCIKTTDAVGHVLCHDITRIVKDVVKDTAFRKGHIVQEEDIPVLLSLGKDHLYVWEKDENTLHENEAAQILCDVCINENMHPTDVKEGKIELIADCDGVFQVDVPRLDTINEIDEVMIATRHTNTAVKKGDRLLGTRVIPLVIANPVSFLSTASSAVYTGISCHCSRISSASRSRSKSATRKEIGLYPATKALRITFGLSPIKIPGAGSAYRNNCTSDNLA